MKVVQVLYSGLGGHGSVAFSLATAAEDRWDNRMLFYGIEPMLSEYSRLCHEKKIHFQYIRALEGYFWRSWGKLYRALEAAAPEAIVLHSVKTILPCWLYARRHKIPLIAVEHQPNHLKKKSEWVVSYLLQKLAISVVVLTTEYKEELRKNLKLGWNRSRVCLIPNGIDTEVFAPRHRNPTKGVIRVGMAARFTQSKRQDLLVDAAALLVFENPLDTWQFTLAGDGENQEAIRDKIDQAGLSKAIKMPGLLGYDELREWFSGLDIYVHASDGETLSTSLLQAMAMGLPIAASDVEGISNLLDQELQCGVLVSENSAALFADNLRRLAIEREFSKKLGAQARARAVRDFGQEKMFDKYMELLVK